LSHGTVIGAGTALSLSNAWRHIVIVGPIVIIHRRTLTASHILVAT